MEKAVDIVGGLDLKDVAEGGTVFEVSCDPQNENDTKEDEEYSIALQNYLKLECLEVGVLYDGSEPFSNIASQMQNLLQNGKIKKKILREGYGSKPEEHTNVNIHYNAYIEYEAQPFDSTYARKKPTNFVIGEGQVIEGLEIAVLSMKLNEKAQFLIDPELAFRSGGLGRIPPNSVVLFEIELLNVQKSLQGTDPERNDKDFQIVYPTCCALSIQGKNLVKLQDYHSAIKVYCSAVDKLEEAILSDYNDQEKSEKLLIRLCTNLLVCFTHAQNPKRGCIFAQKIYEMAKNKTFQVSAKVYFNHARCLRMLGGYDHAHRRLAQARALEPNSQVIQQEFLLLKEAREKYKKQLQNLGRAFVTS